MKGYSRGVAHNGARRVHGQFPRDPVRDHVSRSPHEDVRDPGEHTVEFGSGGGFTLDVVYHLTVQ